MRWFHGGCAVASIITLSRLSGFLSIAWASSEWGSRSSEKRLTVRCGTSATGKACSDVVNANCNAYLGASADGDDESNELAPLLSDGEASRVEAP